MTQYVNEAIAGDKEAFEQLVQLHKPKLIAAAFSYMKNYEEAQDAVQETFIKAFQSLQQLQEPNYFSTWVYKIMIRQCFHMLRQKKQTLDIQMELQQLYVLQQETTTKYDDLYEGLGMLRQEYQTVLLLHYFYDFKLYEIAAMTEKPLNTVKIQLYRARKQLRQKLETMIKKPIKQQDVKDMLKEQLKTAASKFITIPKQYELCIEDVEDEKASFYWQKPNKEEGYYIELDRNGKLLSLIQPPSQVKETISIEEQQRIAEAFLTTAYPDALHYFTLSNLTKHEDCTSFRYVQFVGGVPLASYYCVIDISYNGQVLNFNFRGFTKNPPHMPEKLVPKEAILKQLYDADWKPRLTYLSSESYSVPASGLYVVYNNPIVYHTFNAVTKLDTLEEETFEVELEHFAPLPAVVPFSRKETIEEIIGINDSMEIIRKTELNPNVQGIVWREKNWQAPVDKSMQSFMMDRFEQTVKAEINVNTNRINGFIWFKERNGELDLTYEACRTIAVQFIMTYYEDYVPYLQMKLDEPNFNELHRAHFSFRLFIDGHEIDGESFELSVNKTTGFIDMLMTPKLDLSVIKAYTPMPRLPLEEAKSSLQQVDALLQWTKNYESDELEESLYYSFGHRETKQKVIGINAVTGELIWTRF